MSGTTLSFLTEYVKHKSVFDDPDKAEKVFKDQKHFTVSLFDALREGCLVLDKTLYIKSVNTSFEELFDVDKEDIHGKQLYELGNGQWDIPEFRQLLEEILPKKKEINNYKVVHEFEDLGRRVMMVNARMINHLELVLLAIEDITELDETHHKLEAKVKERTQQAHRLASKLRQIEEHERKKISELLHDDIQQLLVALQMDLKILSKKSEKDSTANDQKEHLQRVLDLSEKAIKTTRDLTSALSLPVSEYEDLTDLLKWLKHKFEKLYNFTVNLNIDADFKILQETLRTDLLQFIRECLFNVIKHADTDHAEIKVNKSEDDFIVIQVIDNGKGFKVEQKELSFGLSNIKDRIGLHDGELKIHSAPGAGTTMEFRIPIVKDLLSYNA